MRIKAIEINNYPEIKEGEVTPFSSGSEFGDWHYRNCENCQSYKDDVAITCDMEYVLGIAYLGHGKVTSEVNEIIFGNNGDCSRRKPQKKEAG